MNFIDLTHWLAYNYHTDQEVGQDWLTDWHQIMGKSRWTDWLATVYTLKGVPLAGGLVKKNSEQI